jgi:hypothetical protein
MVVVDRGEGAELATAAEVESGLYRENCYNGTLNKWLR